MNLCFPSSTFIFLSAVLIFLHLFSVFWHSFSGRFCLYLQRILSRWYPVCSISVQSPVKTLHLQSLAPEQFCIWIVFRRTNLPYGYIQWRLVITTISCIILFSFIIPNFITKLFFFHNDSIAVSMTYFSNENRFKIMFLYGLTLFFTVVKSYVIPCLYQCDKTDINYMVDDIYIMQASGKRL